VRARHLVVFLIFVTLARDALYIVFVNGFDLDVALVPGLISRPPKADLGTMKV